MKSFYKQIQKTLKTGGASIKTVKSGPDAYFNVENRARLNLCSNNYLGLAGDPILKKSAKKAINSLGVGTASVRALVGTNSLHVRLEKKLSMFKKTEDSIVVTSGYLANMAAIQTIMGKEDIVISDELNHASIIDAIRLAGIKHKYIYKHKNTKHLKTQISKITRLINSKKKNGLARTTLIVTDGVFSMDGDLAPLPSLADIAEEHDILLMVDDAHGEGVLGTNGRGIVDHFSLHGRIDIDVGTLSKAFGVNGGFISGKKTLIDFYRWKARQFIFTNALSIPNAAALISAVDLLTKSDTRVKKLWRNTRFLKEGLTKLGFDIGSSETPITPIMLGKEGLARKFTHELFKGLVYATAIVYPMVPKGKARIRLIPSALHTQKELKFALEIIRRVGIKLDVI